MHRGPYACVRKGDGHVPIIRDYHGLAARADADGSGDQAETLGHTDAALAIADEIAAIHQVVDRGFDVTAGFIERTGELVDEEMLSLGGAQTPEDLAFEGLPCVFVHTPNAVTSPKFPLMKSNRFWIKISTIHSGTRFMENAWPAELVLICAPPAIASISATKSKAPMVCASVVGFLHVPYVYEGNIRSQSTVFTEGKMASAHDA